MTDAPLVAALADIRARGPIGEASLDDAIAHADRFVAALPPAPGLVLVDLGSGGGLPGLVIAERRRDAQVWLVERRATRADLLRRAVARLGFEHVRVVADDVRQVARRQGRFADVVTARSFGSPAVTLAAACSLAVPGGLVLVSEPPSTDADRWPAALLAGRGVVDAGTVHGIHRFLAT